MASSVSSEGGWEIVKVQVKQLRSLIKSKSQVESQLKELLTHCVSYYESPHRYERDDSVLQIMSGRSYSPLEAAFMWIGAWRPAAAISLVFSVMGLPVSSGEHSLSEEQLSHLGVKAVGSSEHSLSQEQLSRLACLQRHTSQAEKELSEELATVQMMVADQKVVTYLMTEKMPIDASASKVQQMIESKVSSLRTILKRADQLRVKTLLELHSLLNPMQAAHCSVAAFELAFAMKSLNSSTSSSSTGV